MAEVIWTKEYKVERFREMNKTAKKGQIVFAGSSLMEMFPIEKFVEEDGLPVTVYNRGIGGFVTEELIANIDVCILDLEPSVLFLNIGTNDLSNAEIPIADVMKNYGKILDEVKRCVPEVTLYLMAYYPVNYDAAAENMKACLRIRTNEKIREANKGVELLAKQYGAHYIDVNEPLMDEKGRLKAEYTIEGMHIKEEGYRAIYPLVKPYLTRGGEEK